MFASRFSRSARRFTALAAAAALLLAASFVTPPAATAGWPPLPEPTDTPERPKAPKRAAFTSLSFAPTQPVLFH